MNSTITQEKLTQIANYLEGRRISEGLGTKDSPCSVAAINLALTGRLTDTIPDCMSPVIGKWIIIIQDGMSDDVRNSDAWRALLPQAAGTGRDPNQELRRLKIIVDWMWAALASGQPLADANGFGDEWATMCRERTRDSAQTAARAATWAAESIDAKASWLARAAMWAAQAATAAARAAAEAVMWAETWDTLDPVGLLKQLIDA